MMEEMEVGELYGDDVRMEEADAKVIPGENPLLIDLVVSKLVNMMDSFNDLKSFRVVCKLWRELSLKRWRHDATLVLGPPETGNEEGDRVISKDYVPVDTFLDFVNDPDDPLKLWDRPFHNFVLKAVDFTRTIPQSLSLNENEGALWNYLDMLGDFSFGFRFCTVKNPMNVEVPLIEKILTQKLLRASKVTLSNIDMKKADHLISGRRRAASAHRGYMPRNVNLKCWEIIGEIPMNHQRLLMDCPALEEFTLKKNKQLTFQDLLSVIEDRNVRFPDVPFQLKKLDVLESSFFKGLSMVLRERIDILPGMDLEGFFRLLQELHRPRPPPPPNFRALCQSLEYLSLSLETSEFMLNGGVDNIGRVLSPMLESCQNSLKTLKLFRGPYTSAQPSSENHPTFTLELAALEQLDLYGNLVDNFRFLQMTPNLKQLCIDTRCIDLKYHLLCQHANTVMEEDEAWKRLQRQYRPFWQDLLERTSIQWRENLRLEHMTTLKLQCKINFGTIPWLAKCMPNLKVFQAILEDEVTWRMVCKWMGNLEEIGILKGSKVGEEALTGCYGNCELDGEPNPYRITSFKNLKRFQFMAYCGRSDIGDLAVRRGFLEIKTLRMVCLCVGKKFHAKSEQALREHVENVTIIRNTDEFCTPDWCEDSEFLRRLGIKIGKI